ncbi:MAG: hypothetical protein KAV42_09130 [Candidatus Krumholzibacteria bacterium]|nr:hypothetical protein [Candidatus Krumholzibacteria bacterium]
MTEERKSAGISDVLATFSAHVKEHYPEPDLFRANLRNLLKEKQERMDTDMYILSLEKNIVFLQELVIEGEAALELMLGEINESGQLDDGPGPMLTEMENGVKANTAERHREVFIEGVGGMFEELLEVKTSDPGNYQDKLEFNYFFLMTHRMLLFEFFGVLAALKADYHIGEIDEAVQAHVTGHIQMTANYYLGNISVGEIVDAGPDDTTGKSPGS